MFLPAAFKPIGFCFFLLLALPAFSQNNEIVVTSPTGTLFWIYLDGNKQYNNSNTTARVRNLNNDQYDVRIVFADKKIPDLRTTLYLAENCLHAVNREFNFSLTPAYNTHRLQLISCLPLNNSGGYTQIPGNPYYPNNGGVVVYPGNSGGYGYDLNYIPMREQDFENAKRQIRFKALDRDKLTVAKQIISTNYLLSSQVCQLMKIFTFDNSRLELAKFAYDRTLDKGNYYQVNEGFSFTSTADKLNEFLLEKYVGR